MKRLKILLITYYYVPMNNGGVQRPLKMAKFLPQHGIEVVVLTSTEQPGFVMEDDIVRVHDFTRKSHPYLYYPVRFLQKMFFGNGGSPLFLWKRGGKKFSNEIFKKYRPDIVIATSPPVEALELGLFFSEKFGIPLIADFRDGLLFEPVGSRTDFERLGMLEKRVAEHAATLLTVSDPITRYFIDVYHRKDVKTLPNGFDPEDMEGIVPARLETDCVNIVYTGRMSLSDRSCDGHAFFSALKNIVSSRHERKIRLHFAGEISEKEKAVIQPLIECGAIKLYGLLSHKEALALQKGADILLLMTGTARKSVTTGKLYEYLGASRPILALTKGTTAEEIVNKTSSGWIISPEDEKGIYGFLDHTLKYGLNPPERNEEEIAHYSRARQIKMLAEEIRRIAGQDTE